MVGDRAPEVLSPLPPEPAPSAGRDAPSTSAWLAASTAGLGARSAVWISADGRGRGPREERWARALDWSIVRRLAPGEAWHGDAPESSRSARVAAAGSSQLWLRPSGATEAHDDGVLVLAATESRAIAEPLARALAELCARRSVVEEEREALARAGRERAIGRRAAGMTHNLRNQITLALYQLERVKADGGPRDAALVELERALEVARDLCARSLSGGGEGRARSLLLRPVLVEESLAARMHARRGQDVRVLVRCSMDVAVRAELGVLSRLVRNLVSNALEASFPGGAVRLDAADEGESVAISIADDGRGIPPERARELFSGGVSGSGGTGWGTSVLHDGLLELGGELELESEPGRGTTVRVRVPSARAVAQASVLLVDPDPERRRRRVAALAARGARVLACASAEDALARADLHALAEVIVARGLPGAAELRSRAAHAGVPYHVASALDEDPRAPERAASR